MSEWQPIETAPKDGRPIMIFSADSIEPCIWLVFYAVWQDGAGNIAGGNWSNLANDQEFDATPTHWMPLPAPPEPNP